MENINKNIELLRGYYKFLYLGKFLEELLKKNDLSSYATDIPIFTSDKSYFILNSSKITKIMADIFKNPDKKNVFGYITEISAFKGILGITKELIDNSDSFKEFLESKLKDQFFPFEQTIRFCRNILVHAYDSNISIKQTDFVKQKTFLASKKMTKIDLKFKYADFLEERKGNDKYGIDISINFGTLKTGEHFFDIISLHKIYLLGELCYNLSRIFIASNKTSPVKKQTVIIKKQNKRKSKGK